MNICWQSKSESEVAHLCLTLCDLMDCSLSGFSVHGIFQARVPEWFAFSFSRGSSRPRDQTQISCIVGRHFTLLSMLIITFLPRSKCLLISWLQSPYAVIFKPKKVKSIIFPHLYAMKWWDQMLIFFFLMLSFKPAFSLSSFTFIKRLFSSSSLSAIMVTSCQNLMLLIFVPTILIPACLSSSSALYIMYSAYKLNKQGDNIQPWHTPFSI